MIFSTIGCGFSTTTEGVLEYGEAVSRSKAPAIIKPNDFVGLTLKQAKLKLGIKN